MATDEDGSPNDRDDRTGGRAGLPPGIAKQGFIPPGIEKHQCPNVPLPTPSRPRPA